MQAGGVALDAYQDASEGVGFAPFRMIGYAARRLVENRFGIPADSITMTHNGEWVRELVRWITSSHSSAMASIAEEPLA